MGLKTKRIAFLELELEELAKALEEVEAKKDKLERELEEVRLRSGNKVGFCEDDC